MMKDILLDRRYWAYYLFTAIVVASMLLLEDLLEGENDYGPMLVEYVTDIPIFSMITAVISMLGYHIITILNEHLPWEKALWKRFIFEITLVVLIVVLFTVVGSLFVRHFEIMPEDVDDDLGFEILALIMFFISTFMIFGFHEFMILSTDKQYLQYKAGVLEKQNYLIKYEALKSQINPHFLFNSLNVLSSLIYQDTAKSDQFIKKFSDVFRYVLELNQEKLVPVKHELKFLDSYFFLQKIRYGDHLVMKKVIDAATLDKYIPPLTLQLVVENAIKHNVISHEHKLTIVIESAADELVISNNYQHRTNFNGSTGIGQKNLIEKYQLLGEKLPDFFLENDHYVVRLPIMNELAWKEF